jgi:hypothetical protein
LAMPTDGLRAHGYECREISDAEATVDHPMQGRSA